jgi:hypothetical protein
MEDQRIGKSDQEIPEWASFIIRGIQCNTEKTLQLESLIEQLQKTIQIQQNKLEEKKDIEQEIFKSRTTLPFRLSDITNFDGKSSSENNVNSWLFATSSYLKSTRINEKEWVELAVLQLRGAAQGSSMVADCSK